MHFLTEVFFPSLFTVLTAVGMVILAGFTMFAGVFGLIRALVRASYQLDPKETKRLSEQIKVMFEKSAESFRAKHSVPPQPAKPEGTPEQPPRARRFKLKGRVGDCNDVGIHLENYPQNRGWVDYGKLFFRNRQRPLLESAIGSTVTLRVVESKPKGKVFIESIVEMEPDASGIEFLDESKPAVNRPASSSKGGAKRGSQDPLETPLRLAEVLDLTPDDVNCISWERLQKPMRELDSKEIPLLIEHLEGHRRARSQERRVAS